MSEPFHFRGSLPPSKSLVIRALLLTIHQPNIGIPVLSACADVQKMAAACRLLSRDDPHVQIDCGEAGLVLRLCLAYAARRPGRTTLIGSPRLLSRPHDTLVSALRQLGAQVDFDHARGSVHVQSLVNGWRDPGRPLQLAGASSSQFASALLLNAWALPFALRLHVGTDPVSQGYLQMSQRMAARFGMLIRDDGDGTLTIPADQVPIAGEAESEADVSSAFAVAALAAVGGTAHIRNFPQHSQQPDVAFVDFLRAMGMPICADERGLLVTRAALPLRPLQVDVAGCPDLVPVLSVLCGLANGDSLLSGAPHLRDKESDRIASSAALLRLLGRQVEERDDGLKIVGRPFSASDAARPLHVDAGRDHRVVMAAAVARQAGFPLSISSLDAVEKSFPELLSIANLH